MHVSISEVNTAVLLKISFFCDLTAWSLMCIFRRFEAHNAVFMFKKLALKMKGYDISKRLEVHVQRHSTISQNNLTCMCVDPRTQ